MTGVVFDSNVYVSALLFGGTPRKALELAQQGLFQVNVSPFIMAEVQRTLRLKFRWSDSAIRDAARMLWGSAVRVRPRLKISDCIDPDDNRVLECALAADCRILVTGDAHLLVMHPWRGISILTPRDFLEGGRPAAR